VLTDSAGVPAKLFHTLRNIRDRDGLHWVVTDFDDEKFMQLRGSLPDSVAVEVEGFNLEELFMESIESGRDDT
jgi:hypothetical protein